jgi:hypothetical protein
VFFLKRGSYVVSFGPRWWITSGYVKLDEIAKTYWKAFLSLPADGAVASTGKNSWTVCRNTPWLQRAENDGGDGG